MGDVLQVVNKDDPSWWQVGGSRRLGVLNWRIWVGLTGGFGWVKNWKI